MTHHEEVEGEGEGKDVCLSVSAKLILKATLDIFVYVLYTEALLGPSVTWLRSAWCLLKIRNLIVLCGKLKVTFVDSSYIFER